MDESIQTEHQQLTLVTRKSCFGLPTACPSCLLVYIYLKFAFNSCYSFTYPDSGISSDGSCAYMIYYSDLPWPIGKLLYLKQVYNVKRLLGLSKDNSERREEEIYRRASIAYQVLSSKLIRKPRYFEANCTLEHTNLVKYADNHKAQLIDTESSSSPSSLSSSSVPRRGPSNWNLKLKSQPKRERTDEEKSFRRKAKYFLVAQMVAVLVYISLLGGSEADAWQ